MSGCNEQKGVAEVAFGISGQHFVFLRIGLTACALTLLLSVQSVCETAGPWQSHGILLVPGIFKLHNLEVLCVFVKSLENWELKLCYHKVYAPSPMKASRL